MTRFKRIFAQLLCLLTLMSCLALPADAAGELNINTTVTLTIKLGYKLKDISFTVYRIARLQADGTLEALAPFQEYVQNILKTDKESDWADIAQELDQDTEALSKAVGTKTAATDQNGEAVIAGLEPGLYLIGSTKTTDSGKIYVTAASLVTLPQKDGQVWNKKVSVNAKVEVSPEDRDLKVVKVWQDACHPGRRPSSVVIHLLRDGVCVDSVTLPKNGKWEYTWKDKDMRYTWTVTEDRVSGYKDPAVTYKNGIFTVTNTCNRPGKHYNTKLPQTGQLWWPVPVLLAVGLIFVIIGLVRRREDDYEER